MTSAPPWDPERYYPDDERPPPDPYPLTECDECGHEYPAEMPDCPFKLQGDHE